MSNRRTNIIAACLLIFVFLTALLSIKDDSLTMDELAHLPAGYSYLTQKDMRLNPEHPPLLKDLAALPLLFIKNVKFPSEIPAWQQDVNGQWDFGRYFLYQTGNPADQMIFWGRFPMILILILLGFYVFKWTKELFGNCASLLALFFFSFSPTLLAHGRLVTTDVGAAAGVFIATYYFIRALKNPSKKNIILAGLVFGIAQLLKFSVILLVPFFGLLGLIWWLTKSGSFLQTIKIGFLVFLIGFALIWPVYQYHVWNYPPEKQLQDAQVYLKDTIEPLKTVILWAADKPIIRAYAQYFTGLSMIFQRVAGGNTTYFLGEVSNLGWKEYFPIVYLIKEPLAFHFLTLIAFLYALFLIKKSSIKDWLKSHFSEFAMITFVMLYWVVSIKGNLNIGIRHLLPVFPLTIVLVSSMTAKLLKEPHLKIKYALLMVLILWQAISVISVYPHFLAYFNEAVGGPDQGYKYVVDSNLDWGQDLKRLKNWTEENNVEKIYLDYFGGGSPEYYLGTKYAPWWGQISPEEFPKGNYLAVSASFLQGGRGIRASNYEGPDGYYLWLNNYTPVTKIGYSIFVYKID
ncbi:MAG: glycosyltransferase family 39 protein [Candidatus Pacebacteria bacterium]|nr:glycosyltransferase family 39 protein [Candidatus Paceibacterota bacterium]